MAERRNTRAKTAAAMYKNNGMVDTTFGSRYAFSRPVPVNAGRPIMGLASVGVGADGTVGDYNHVAIPRSTRTKRLRSQQENNYEVYGTAPYLGRGDGVILHPQLSTRLRNPRVVDEKSRYHMAEHKINRWDFVRRANVVQPTITDMIGISSRNDPVYA